MSDDMHELDSVIEEMATKNRRDRGQGFRGAVIKPVLAETTYLLQAASAVLGLLAVVFLVLSLREGRYVIAIVDAIAVIVNGVLFYIQIVIRRRLLSGL